MQREALLTNAVMHIAPSIKKWITLSHITHNNFGCGSACPELVEVAALVAGMVNAILQTYIFFSLELFLYGRRFIDVCN